jgi:cysteinyl-tRNA synthetase
VDDRTIGAAHSAGITLGEHTAPFIREFFEDRDYLRIRPAHVYPRATESIESMVSLVERLLERAVAYRGEDGSVYFAVSRFQPYGRLARLDKRGLKVGARVASDEYGKEDIRDFALWKTASEADEAVGAAWDAPFGRGRPGWHLECSAMALHEIRSRFGVETLDIHAGGVDLIFPHHENEIAQAEGATDQPFARWWLHGEFLLMDDTKMSKRYGNVLTARDLQEHGIDGAAVRMLVFSTHYRQQLSFTEEALAGAAEGVRRLGEFATRLGELAAGATDGGPADPPGPVAELRRDFLVAMDNDLNSPRALGAVFSFARTANRELDQGRWRAGEARAAQDALGQTMEVLDVLPSVRQVDRGLEQWIDEQIAARERARRAGDYRTADAIRAKVAERGIELEDTSQGTRWRSRGS